MEEKTNKSEQDFVNLESNAVTEVLFCEPCGAIRAICFTDAGLAEASVSGAVISYGALGLNRANETALRLFPLQSDKSTHFCVLRDGAAACALDFRQTLIRKAEKSASLGLSVKAATENAFFVFKNDREGNPSCEYADVGGFLSTYPQNRTGDVAATVVEGLIKKGVRCGGFFHGYGASEQVIALPFLPLTEAADGVVLLRREAKRVAGASGMYCSFMPKPRTEGAGAGFTLAFEIKCADKRKAEAFAAGVLIHAPEYTVFTDSCANSYFRLHGADCPHYVCWSENSIDALWLISRIDEKIVMRASFPDASGNVYAILAAIVEAGFMGIEAELNLPEPVSELTPIIIKDAVRLPMSLGEAVALSEGSGFMRRVLGEGAANVYFGLKKKEAEEFSPQAGERDYLDRYFECL